MQIYVLSFKKASMWFQKMMLRQKSEHLFRFAEWLPLKLSLMYNSTVIVDDIQS